MDGRAKRSVICISGALLFVAICTFLFVFIRSRLKNNTPQKGYTNPDAFSAGTDNSTAFTFEYSKYNSDGTADGFSQSRGFIMHRDKAQHEKMMPWAASDDVPARVEEVVTKYDAVSLFMQYSETPFEQTACADPDTYYFFSFSKEGKSYTFSIKQINLSLNQYSEVVKRIEAFFAELDQVLYNIPAYRDVVYVTDAME